MLDRESHFLLQHFTINPRVFLVQISTFHHIFLCFPQFSSVFEGIFCKKPVAFNHGTIPSPLPQCRSAAGRHRAADAGRIGRTRRVRRVRRKAREEVQGLRPVGDLPADPNQCGDNLGNDDDDDDNDDDVEDEDVEDEDLRKMRWRRRMLRKMRWRMMM